MSIGSHAHCGCPVIHLESPPEVTIVFGGVTVTHSESGPVSHYEGPYEATPSRETQILQTAGLLLDGNITLDPIPQNYGLITYNGYELTVS